MTYNERQGDVLHMAWRSFCNSGGLEVIFAGLEARLHPLPHTVQYGICVLSPVHRSSCSYDLTAEL